MIITIIFRVAIYVFHRDVFVFSLSSFEWSDYDIQRISHQITFDSNQIENFLNVGLSYNFW